jgi:hypothetical protein
MEVLSSSGVGVCLKFRTPAELKCVMTEAMKIIDNLMSNDKYSDDPEITVKYRTMRIIFY